MDIHSLKQHLINNEELLELLLEEIGFTDVNGEFNHGEEFRCAWEDGGNPTSVKINKSTLSSVCFSRNIKGDIITLIQEKLRLSLSETLKKIASITGFNNQEAVKYELPFGGFFKKIHKIKKNKYIDDIETYPESILNDYMIMPSAQFLRDGISYETQIKYQVGYDLTTNRIIVPWRSLSGDIVGVMGRLNKDEIEEWENKWFPTLAFSKSKTLFGFSQNYNAIQEKSFVIIGESEKFPMKLDTYGIDIGLGLGGSSLSQFQANNIKSLFPKKIIVSMDEGLDESVSRDIAKRLKMDTFFENEVGYIYDKDNKYLIKGSKMSPSDLSKDDFKKLLVECTKKI